MQVRKSVIINRLLVFLPSSIVIGSLMAAGCKPAPDARAAQPQLSAEDKAKKAQLEGKAETNMRIDQIKRSNLSAEQKQQMINQVSASPRK